MLFFLFFSRLVLAAPAPLSVSPGAPALVFDLAAVNVASAQKLVNKSRISLADLTGVLPSHPKRAVVLYFFDITAGHSSLRTLDKLQQRYKNKDVQVLGICAGVQDVAPISTVLQQNSVRFPVLHDLHDVVSSRYGITDYPMTIVVDAKGHVFAIGKPPESEIETEIAAELDGVLSAS